MTREIIALALEGEGLKAGAQGFTIPDDREATVFVGTPGDLLPVAKVVRVELRDKYISLQTSKDERYLFAYDDVLGFRLLAGAQTRERTAGFAR